jgi:amino acid adenylation domain-containing protein
MASAHNLVEWLDDAAHLFPDRPAIEDTAARVISYAELRELGRRVQNRLAAVGVRTGDTVGVFMKKSIDTLVAFQATLRAGAAYVPADPLAPASRAAFMFSDCLAAAIVVDEEFAADLRTELDTLGHCPPLLVVPAQSGGKRWRIEAVAGDAAAAPAATEPRDLAFMLYTSGSTGQPKAVMLTHGNVLTFIDWCSGEFTPTGRDKFAVHGPLQFSLPVFNLYVAWKHGATVVLIDEQTARVPQLVAPLIDRIGITVWFSTPTILSLLAQSGLLPSLSLASLRLVMFAGEAFAIGNLRSLHQQLPHPRYVHILGSTETHIMAHQDVSADMLRGATRIPVGRVCSHFRHRVIAQDGAEVTSRGEGELCLSGPAVTPGYWRRPESEAFFLDDNGDRWYRTRDIVAVQPDGTLVYRGRVDRMIKKRGNRVELGEIEACLAANSGVKEAAVVAVDDTELGTRVQAFVVRCERSEPTIIQLKAHCAGNLPSYMVPDGFSFCNALPRTSTGKVDFPRLKELV